MVLCLVVGHNKISAFIHCFVFILLCSYLKSLLEPFNAIADRFIENLVPLADGKTDVPMKIKFGEFTLEVISKVYNTVVLCNIELLGIDCNLGHKIVLLGGS